MKVKFSWVLAWIIASILLMYAGLLACFMFRSLVGEHMILVSVVMLPCTFVLAEHTEE